MTRLRVQLAFLNDLTRRLRDTHGGTHLQTLEQPEFAALCHELIVHRLDLPFAPHLRHAAAL